MELEFVFMRVKGFLSDMGFLASGVHVERRLEENGIFIKIPDQILSSFDWKIGANDKNARESLSTELPLCKRDTIPEIGGTVNDSTIAFIENEPQAIALTETASVSFSVQGVRGEPHQGDDGEMSEFGKRYGTGSRTCHSCRLTFNSKLTYNRHYYLFHSKNKKIPNPMEYTTLSGSEPCIVSLQKDVHVKIARDTRSTQPSLIKREIASDNDESNNDSASASRNDNERHSRADDCVDIQHPDLCKSKWKLPVGVENEVRDEQLNKTEFDNGCHDVRFSKALPGESGNLCKIEHDDPPREDNVGSPDDGSSTVLAGHDHLNKASDGHYTQELETEIDRVSDHLVDDRELGEGEAIWNVPFENKTKKKKKVTKEQRRTCTRCKLNFNSDLLYNRHYYYFHNKKRTSRNQKGPSAGEEKSKVSTNECPEKNSTEPIQSSPKVNLAKDESVRPNLDANEPKRQEETKNRVEVRMYRRKKRRNRDGVIKQNRANSEELRRENLTGVGSTARQCHKCEFLFPDLETYMRHYSKCVTGLKYANPTPRCIRCRIRFSNRSDYSRHYRTHHYKKFVGEVDQSVVCEYCGDKFTQLTLDRHLKSVHKDGLKVFPCSECSFKSHSKSLTEDHFTQKHTSETFPCPRCPHRAASKACLRKHMTCHLDRSFPCPICKKDFQRKEHLKVHVKGVHADERPEVCEVCNRRFHSPHMLKRHFIGVHSGKRFACPHCSASYSQRADLKRHIDKTHSDADFVKF